ncbi:MAG: aspartate aminotransferase family protein [Fusobacteria bacterium]|nr:aspartate aminotransferase family protein [Fusobacteriota bacterium]
MDMIKIGEKNLMSTYQKFPVIFRKGRGRYLYDTIGEEYLDLIGGVAVNSLGHCDRGLITVLQEQLEQFVHVSNLYWTKELIQASSRLVNHTHFEKAFFCNSGAEAVESAVKLCRAYGNSSKISRNHIISMTGSFHGRTLGATSVTGQEKYRNGFGPLLQDISYVPFNDYDILMSEIKETTIAIILEPVQGEGGIIAADREYLKKIELLCSERDIVLIFDEVQCGIGRLGTFYAYQYFGVKPDIICLAKGLGGGIPVGAILATKHVAACFKIGSHGSTFGGNALAMSAVNYIVKKIRTRNFLLHIYDVSDYLFEKLCELKSNYSMIKEVRGIGLMLGLEVGDSLSEILKQAFNEKLLLIGAGSSTVRIIPALNITRGEIDEAIFKLNTVFKRISVPEISEHKKIS